MTAIEMLISDHLEKTTFSLTHNRAIKLAHSLLVHEPNDPNNTNDFSMKGYGYRLDRLPGGAELKKKTIQTKMVLGIIILTFLSLILEKLLSLSLFIVIGYPAVILTILLCIINMFYSCLPNSVLRTDMAQAMATLHTAVTLNNAQKNFNKALETFISFQDKQVIGTAVSEVYNEIVRLKDKKISHNQPIDALTTLINKMNTILTIGTDDSAQQFMREYHGIFANIKHQVSFFISSDQSQLDQSVKKFAQVLPNYQPIQERTRIAQEEQSKLNALYNLV